jgi:hypothetical protein
VTTGIAKVLAGVKVNMGFGAKTADINFNQKNAEIENGQSEKHDDGSQVFFEGKKQDDEEEYKK